MKQVIIWILSLTVAVSLWTNTYSQTDDSHNTYNINAVYRLPPERNGLTESAFKLIAYVRIDRWEKTANIILDIRSTQSTPSNPNPSYVKSYNYMGKAYGDQHVGPEVFNPIYASNITYEVNISDGTHRWIKNVDGKSNIFGPVDKNLKAAEVSVYVKIASINFFGGTNSIENKIKAFLSAGSTSSVNKQNNASADAPVAAPGRISPGFNGIVRNTNSGQESSAASTIAPTRNGGGEQVAAAGKISTASQNGVVPNNYIENATTSTNKPWNQQQVNEYTQNSIAERQARVDAVQRQSDATINSINMLGNFIASQMRENQDAKQREYAARVAEERERAEAERAATSRKERTLANRKALISSFNGGKVPLSSQKGLSDEIYFFFYAYDPSAIEDTKMTMHVSNVFAIARYGDGTWPFTSNLLEDIAEVAKGNKVELSGYYRSENEAIQKREEFIGGINDLSLNQGTLTYKGSQAAGSATSDFWGDGNASKNATQPPAANKEPVNKSNNEDDFWGDAGASQKVSEAPATKKKPSAESAAETDFWGNPVKAESNKNSDADFWGEPAKPAPKKAVPGKSIKKKVAQPK